MTLSPAPGASAMSGAPAEEAPATQDAAVAVRSLNFGYKDSVGRDKQVLFDIDMRLPRGSRCLLLGANGAGKSTLLRVLAGKHLLPDKTSVMTLGKPAFYQTLGVSGINYLGSGWTQTVAFAGNHIPFQADIAISEMSAHLQEEFPERAAELMEILEIDPDWRMHLVSDGQRRRCQILLGLLRPFQLLLLDELTVDLDVLARASFLRYLVRECESRGATIIYATHIFDGLEIFPTHVLALDEGRQVVFENYNELQVRPDFTSLYRYVESFLIEMKRRRDERAKGQVRRAKEAPQPPNLVNCGYTPGRMAAYFQG
jgi:CCR4-NOT complex subunit CAF16